MHQLAGGYKYLRTYDILICGDSESRCALIGTVENQIRIRNCELEPEMCGRGRSPPLYSLYKGVRVYLGWKV